LRREGYSFCIIAGGNRPEKLDLLIDSIHQQGIGSYEIVVAGAAHQRPDVTYVPRENAALHGRTNYLRNTAAEHSAFENLVFCDDDICLTSGWFSSVEQHKHCALVSTRLLNLDGTRHWDWATCGGPRGLILLDYDESDPDVYVPGGLLLMGANIWETLRWDDTLGYGQAEDVVLSRSARQAGFTSTFCGEAVAIHNDHTYTQIGRKVPRRSAAAATAWLSNTWKGLDPGELGLRGLRELKDGNLTDAVDLLRYALYLLPGYDSAAQLLLRIEEGCGGRIDSGAWQPTPLVATTLWQSRTR
jgi:hypothetical protein